MLTHRACIIWMLINSLLPVWISSVPGRLAAQTNTPPQTTNSAETAEIRQLINSLDAPRRSERMRAESLLIEHGPRVLPWIAAASPATAGAEEALQRIQRTVEERAARLELEGTQISFSKDLAPWTVVSALDALSQQSGTRINFDSTSTAAEKMLSLPDEDLLFWNALDEVCREAHLGWKWTSNSAITVSPDDSEPSGAITVSGPFRIQAATSQQRQNLTGPIQTLRLKLRLDVQANVTPYYVLIEDSKVSLSTQETTFEPFTPQARREIPFDGQTSRFSIDFIRDPEVSLQEAMLTGGLQVRCGSGLTELHFPLNIGLPVRKSAGLTGVELRHITQRDDQLTVVIRVMYPVGVNWESHRLGLLHQEAWLQSTDEKKIPHRVMELTRNDGRVQDVRYSFRVETTPARELTFVYRTPAVFEFVDIPFQLPVDLTPANSP